MVNISIILCAHNPPKECWRRVLNAVHASALASNSPAELIIVDSASNPPLTALPEMTIDWGIPFSLVRSEVPGLAIARKLGFERSSGEIVIFFDDDNIPEQSFVSNAGAEFEALPHLAALGPGNIKVEWAPGSPAWIESFSSHFQSKRVPRLQYGCADGWASYYPPGSGLCLRRWVMQRYLERIAAGTRMLEGRTGNNLSSGEDSQIVYEAIRHGACAGVSPNLALVHYTALRKTRLSYLLRLAFGVHASGEQAIYISFPERIQELYDQAPKSSAVLAQILIVVAKGLVGGKLRARAVGLAAYMGTAAGRYRVQGVRPPIAVRLAERWLSS